MMAIKIEPKHIADDIDREEKRSRGDWGYDQRHQRNRESANRWQAALRKPDKKCRNDCDCEKEGRMFDHILVMSNF